MKVGITGMGTVGRAVYNGFSPVIGDLKCFDVCGQGSIEDMYDRDFIFICIPTMTLGGSTGDLGIQIYTPIVNLAKTIISNSGRDDITFILKSTVLPGTTMELKEICGCDWVFNPEFLTDRTADSDFINAPRIILGGTGGVGVQKVEELYRMRFRYTPIIVTTSKVAEMAKYMTNLYFMSKISFMNEMHSVARDSGISWDSLVKCFSTDPRVENSHLDVPGPDGQMGFGGKCFPENIDTFLWYCRRLGYEHDFVNQVRETNKKHRV